MSPEDVDLGDSPLEGSKDVGRQLEEDGGLGRMIMFGESHLRRAIEEYVAHYHSERAHQGLGNELIEPGPDSRTGDVVESERLRGLLRSYRRAA